MGLRKRRRESSSKDSKWETGSSRKFGRGKGDSRSKESESDFAKGEYPAERDWESNSKFESDCDGLKQIISFKTDRDIFDLLKPEADSEAPDDVVQHLFDFNYGDVGRSIDAHWFVDSQAIRHSFSNKHVEGGIAYLERVLTPQRPPCPFDIWKRLTIYKECHYALRGDADTLVVVAHGVNMESPSDPRGDQPKALADDILSSSHYAKGDMAGSLREGYARLRPEATVDFTTVIVRRDKLFLVAAAPASVRLVRKYREREPFESLEPGPYGQVVCPDRKRFVKARGIKRQFNSFDGIKAGIPEEFHVEVTEIQLKQGDEMLAIISGKEFDNQYLSYSSMLHGGVKLEDVCEKVVDKAGEPKSWMALLQFPQFMAEPGKLSFERYVSNWFFSGLPNSVVCIPK